MIQEHDVKEQNYQAAKEKEMYAKIRQEEGAEYNLGRTGSNFNLGGNNGSESPNPFYNPQRLDQMAEASRMNQENQNMG